MKNVLLFLVAGVLLMPAFKVFGQEAQAPVYKEGECWLFRSVSKNFQGYVSGVLAMPVNGDHKICFMEVNLSRWMEVQNHKYQLVAYGITFYT